MGSQSNHLYGFIAVKKDIYAEFDKLRAENGWTASFCVEKLLEMYKLINKKI